MGYDLEIGEVDLKIIRLLQEDPRSFSKIAGSLDVSIGTVYNHVKKLEDNDILRGYTVKVNSDKLGYDLTAVMLVQVDSHYRAKVARELAEFNDIIVLYNITGEYDMLVIIRLKDNIMLNNFIKNIQKLPNVKKIHVSVALDVIKEDFKVKL